MQWKIYGNSNKETTDKHRCIFVWIFNANNKHLLQRNKKNLKLTWKRDFVSIPKRHTNSLSDPKRLGIKLIQLKHLPSLNPQWITNKATTEEVKAEEKQSIIRKSRLQSNIYNLIPFTNMAPRHDLSLNAVRLSKEVSWKHCFQVKSIGKLSGLLEPLINQVF